MEKFLNGRILVMSWSEGHFRWSWWGVDRMWEVKWEYILSQWNKKLYALLIIAFLQNCCWMDYILNLINVKLLKVSFLKLYLDLENLFQINYCANKNIFEKDVTQNVSSFYYLKLDSYQQANKRWTATHTSVVERRF